MLGLDATPTLKEDESGTARSQSLFARHLGKLSTRSEGAAWVIGRFLRKGKSFELIREGQRLRSEFLIPDKAEILFCREGQILELSDFVSMLRAGDWIAFHAAGDGTPARIGLLAPNLPAKDSVEESGRQGFLKRGALSPKVFQFEDFKSLLDRHFRARSFQRLSTPTLVPSPGTEPFLDVFATEFSRGADLRQFYLPTSPELHLKKALALGEEKIFELRSVFRNSEISEKHQPEFHMLEWYRAFANLKQIKEDCVHLLREVSGDPELAFSSVSVSELFAQLGLELKPETSAEELKSWCRRLGVHFSEDDLWDDLFYRIFVDRIEAFLPSGHPLFVEKYPPSQAALARVGSDGWAERFELYWRGLEIANAYHELNDPVEQRRRSLNDNEIRQKLGRPRLALDEEFFRALECGLPPSAGIALGVERLFMALTGLENISELSAFPMRTV